MRSSSFCAAANSSDATALASPPAIPLPLTVATRSPGRSDAPATARDDSRTMPAERDDSICRPVPGYCFERAPRPDYARQLAVCNLFDFDAKSMGRMWR